MLIPQELQLSRLKGAQFGSVDFSAQSENLGELGCL